MTSFWSSCWRCRRPTYCARGSLPGDRHRQEQRVEPGIIEAFADIAACCKDQALSVVRDMQCCSGLLAVFCGHAASQHYEISHEWRKSLVKIIEVVLSLCQDDRRTLRLERFQHIIENQIVPPAVLRQSRIDCGHGGAFDRRQRGRQFKLRCTIGCAMANATFGGLNSCINPVANRAALHEDNGMMPVLPCHGRG